MPRKAAAPIRRRNYGSNHGYYLGDADNPAKGRGVTTLIKSGMPSDALMYWAAREVAEEAVDGSDVWEPILLKDGRDEAIRYLKGAPWRTRNKGGQRGTKVHKWAELLAKGETIVPEGDEEPYVDRFLEWWDEWDVRPVELPNGDLAVELCVVNVEHQYGGTLDLVAELAGWHPDGSSAVVAVDYKSGKGIHPETGAQLTAYVHAPEYLPKADGSEGVRPLAELGIEGAVTVHLQPDHATTYPVDVSDARYLDFRYIVQVAEIVGVHKDVPGRAESWIGEAVAPYVGEGSDG